jgi:hypothetical protein
MRTISIACGTGIIGNGDDFIVRLLFGATINLSSSLLVFGGTLPFLEKMHVPPPRVW